MRRLGGGSISAGFGATIFFGTDNMTPRAKVVQRTRLHFFWEAQIWYSRDPDQCPMDGQFQNELRPWG